MQEKLNKACNSFGRKYIDWDGCWTIPALAVVLTIIYYIVGTLVFFSVIAIIVIWNLAKWIWKKMTILDEMNEREVENV